MQMGQAAPFLLSLHSREGGKLKSFFLPWVFVGCRFDSEEEEEEEEEKLEAIRRKEEEEKGVTLVVKVDKGVGRVARWPPILFFFKEQVLWVRSEP